MINRTWRKRSRRSSAPFLQESNRTRRQYAIGPCGDTPPPALSRTQSCGAPALPNAVIKMSNAAIATFVVVGGIVWGGFLLILMTAVGKESRKTDQG